MDTKEQQQKYANNEHTPSSFLMYSEEEQKPYPSIKNHLVCNELLGNYFF